MPLSVRARIRLAPPVTAGGRLLVPLVRMLTVSHAGGGMAHCTPVALLIGEDGAWFFVPLEDGIGQDILSGLDLAPQGIPAACMDEPGRGAGG
jgi:hypothetical protein